MQHSIPLETLVSTLIEMKNYKARQILVPQKVEPIVSEESFLSVSFAFYASASHSSVYNSAGIFCKSLEIDEKKTGI